MVEPDRPHFEIFVERILKFRNLSYYGDVAED